MIYSFNSVAAAIHRVAREKGWWRDCEGSPTHTDFTAEQVDNGFDPGRRNLPEAISLMHEELSEALGEYRDGRAFNELYFYNTQTRTKHTVEEAIERFGSLIAASEHWKPEGVAVEFIDCVIRIMDYFGAYETDVDLLMSLKRRYNEHRPYRHGGKAA